MGSLIKRANFKFFFQLVVASGVTKMSVSLTAALPIQNLIKPVLGFENRPKTIFARDQLLPVLLDPPERKSPKMRYNLEVKLLEGKNLVIRDSTGTSDPYVKFKYNNKVLFKSRTVYKSLDPIWNDSFSSNEITDLKLPLKIVVKDYDRFGVNDFMGEADVDLSAYELNSMKTLKVLLNGVSPDENMGYLMLEMMITSSATIINPEEQPADKTPSPKIIQTLFKNPSIKRSDSRKFHKPNKTVAATVHVVIIEAKRLMHTDSNANSPLPNPFAQIKYSNQVHTTKPVERTLEPKWYEEFEIYKYDDDLCDGKIEIIVIDKRKNICMGKCWIDLSDFEKEITHKKWFELGEGIGSLLCLLTVNVPSSLDTVNDIVDDEDETPQKSSSNFVEYSLKNSLKDFKDIGRLSVKVFRAQGLASADINGKSDPYCVVELVNSKLQSHTVYNSLNPVWNKEFTFQVKDIHSLVELTVMDEDSTGSPEFLGKLAIPLMSIKNKQKRWFALKNSRLNQRAKGQILLEFDLQYNSIRALRRTFKPKEQKYTAREMKFKRSIFVKNLLRLKSFAPRVDDVPHYLELCLSWETPAVSFCAFMGSMLLTYYFELFMIPLVCLMLLFKNYMQILLTPASSNNHYIEKEEEANEDLFADEKNENLSLKERWNEMQDGLVMMQNALEFLASTAERLKNCFNFTQPFLSWTAAVLLSLATLIFYLIPIRYLVMIYIMKRFTKKLRNPHSVPNNEIIDFISRVPSDDDLKTYREYRTDAVAAVLSSESAKRLNKNVSIKH